MIDLHHLNQNELCGDYLHMILLNKFYEFYPTFERATQQFVQHINKTRDSKDKVHVTLGFYNVGNEQTIRELKAFQIGRLISLQGTITRTTEVRPELMSGTFKCLECNAFVQNVMQ